MLVNLDAVLKRAKAEKYAVGLFNTHDTDMLEAAIAAAEEARSPIIIGTAEVLLPYGDLPLISPALIAAAKRASVPVVVHYDHGLTFGKTMEALKLGFSSVMYDASAKDYATNIAETAEVAKIAHAFGATIEGEIGHVGSAAAGDEEATSTTVEEAVTFAKGTGVRALAIMVGTAHGHYKKAPKLDIDRIAEIHAALPEVSLVLHGGSGIPDEQIKAAINAGIRKINFGTDVCYSFLDKVFETSREKIAIDVFMKDAIQNVKAFGIEKIKLLGADGKAE
jgi:fructose-bisphosphate aldolase class II